MALPNSRKLKVITLTIGGSSFEAQLKTWKLENNTNDGDTTYTFSPDGAIVEDSDPDWSFTGTFLADWRSGGISDFLMLHDGENAAFVLVNHPDQVGEITQYTGYLKIKAPSVGGDARATEETEVSLKVVGEPVYARIG